MSPDLAWWRTTPDTTIPGSGPITLTRERVIPAPPEARESGSAVLLVVERDPHVRELEAYFLREAGFRVEFALDGAEALHLVGAMRPDVVITEILVPRLDGLAVCRQIKEDPDLRGTAVLIFSILAAEARAREAGADAFLRKPLADQSLVRTVQKLLAMREVA
ncbi:MAG: response regulator [Gemmatimonadota bacterium]